MHYQILFIILYTLYLNTIINKFILKIIQILEWIYFEKYGVSFIEQFSLNYISPWIGGGNDNNQQVPGTMAILIIF